MAKKQYVVVSNAHMGKGLYEIKSGTPVGAAKWNTLGKGVVFEAEEADIQKLLKVGAIKPYTGKSDANEPEPVVAAAAPKSGRGGR
jgi:hypothetical protein